MSNSMHDPIFLIYADGIHKLIVVVGPFKQMDDARLFDVGMHYAAKESRDFQPKAIVELPDDQWDAYIFHATHDKTFNNLKVAVWDKAREIRAAMENGYELQDMIVDPYEWTNSIASRLNQLQKTVTGK